MRLKVIQATLKIGTEMIHVRFMMKVKNFQIMIRELSFSAMVIAQIFAKF